MTRTQSLVPASLSSAGTSPTVAPSIGPATPTKMKRRKKSAAFVQSRGSPSSARGNPTGGFQIVICHLTVSGDKGMGLVFDHNGAPPNQKIWIDEIIDDTPASESEAHVGDTLIEVNGTNVQNLEIMRVMKLMTAQHLSLTFLRDPKRLGFRQKQSESKVMYDVRRNSRSPRGRAASALPFQTAGEPPDSHYRPRLGSSPRGRSLVPVVENRQHFASSPTNRASTPNNVLAAMSALANRRKVGD